MKKVSKLSLREVFNRLLAKSGLPATVFITGACVLVIEVVATRILSPYFGNTIFTVSSVISVVLAALSVGYVVGGKLSDKFPKPSVFYSIIGLSGISILVLQLLNRQVLPDLGERLSITSGPLVSSMILFFLPSLLLGTLSPFAIKLQSLQTPKRGIGSISGGIFFWSTLGSIFGSLSAGFWLIPNFGIDNILLGIGLLLALLGLLPVIRTVNRKVTIGFVVALVLLTSVTLNAKKDYIFSRDGTYEKVQIYDSFYNGHPTRFFQQDRSSSGAMYLDSDELVFDYTKYYSLYQVLKPETKNALVIGGGAYSIPKALLREIPDARVDVSEIEPSLLDLGHKYFNLPNDPRLNNSTEDGRRLLSEQNKNYDLIFSDVYYSLYSIPSHFTTEEFFKLAESRLSDNGVFIANIIGSLSKQSPSLMLSEMRTFRSAFPNSYFFAVNSTSSLEPQNIVFVGYKSDQIVDFNKAAQETQNPIIKDLPSKLIDTSRYELSKYTLLTDNFSPVEHLNKQLLEKFNDNNAAQISGDEMLANIEQQLRYGPRFPTSTGHTKLQNFITSEMKAYTNDVSSQTWTDNSGNAPIALTNIIARFAPENSHRIVLGAHYDTKRYASMDPKDPKGVMPGANDGASGVAVLMELGRYFASSGRESPVGIDLVFFDGEEGSENILNDYQDWQPLGSVYFAQHLSDFYPSELPASGIVLDMVCDKNLDIYKENSSQEYTSRQVNKFWEIGRGIDPQAFKDGKGQTIQDDHSALNVVGVPSFLVIDFDYPAHHTTKDTLNKCSSKSLETIANTTKNYIYSLPRN